MKAAAVAPSFAGLAQALSGPGHIRLPLTPAAHSCTAPALQLDIQCYIQREIPLGWRQVFLLLSAFVPRFLEHDTAALHPWLRAKSGVQKEWVAWLQIFE